jgi:hypothetical protein
MIYLLAFVLGSVACYVGLLSEIAESNIRYVKLGRKPDAGAVLFPIFPLLPLMFVGVAWLLKVFIPAYATFIFAGAFLVLLVCWWRSYARAKAELKRVIDSQKGNLG